MVGRDVEWEPRTVLPYKVLTVTAATIESIAIKMGANGVEEVRLWVHISDMISGKTVEDSSSVRSEIDK